MTWKMNPDGAMCLFQDGKLLASYYKGSKKENGRVLTGQIACLYGEYPDVYLKRVFVDQNETYTRKLITGWLTSKP